MGFSKANDMIHFVSSKIILIPRFYSWDHETKSELFKIFNYDEEDKKILYRGMLKLEMPDFESFDLVSVCDEDNPGPYNLTRYCQLSEKVPDLEATMHLMKLATFPLNFKLNYLP